MSFDVVSLSHLRWDFVYQRPQHLLSRWARHHRVFFVEEPLIGEGPARLETSRRGDGLMVSVPHLPPLEDTEDAEAAQRQLLDELLREHDVRQFVLWYYTPMVLPFTRHLEPLAVVYDCMDELSAFAGAPPAMVEHEAELLRRADIVFAGGQSLYEAKQARHHNVHLFPSSVEADHFARARVVRDEPLDQALIPAPRLGFFGVLDERLDRDLLAAVAAARPDWQLLMLGPVVKIDPASLPQRPNIHYLGPKRYEELPRYLAGWDVALLPFAQNEATRFISPTKTLEYLAAGRPVVSTPIRDVVEPYGRQGFVRIADGAEEFVCAIQAALRPGDRRPDVEALLARTSWDRTWAAMRQVVDTVIGEGRKPATVGSRGPAQEGGSDV